jgi:rhodanese-related sulfurtransferase
MSKKSSRRAPEQRRSSTSWMPLALAGLVVVAGVLALAAWRGLQGQAATAPGALPAEISVAEAAQQRDAGAFILDVREQDEWEQVHIPGATLISLQQLAQRTGEVPKDRPVVVVCRSGNRSAQGRDILRQAGFTEVTSMAGGMNDWQAAGYETVSGP